MWPVRLFSVCLGLVHFNPQTESSLYEYNICKYFFIVPLAVLYIIRMCGKISIISIYIISLVCNWIRYCRSYHKYKNIKTGEYQPHQEKFMTLPHHNCSHRAMFTMRDLVACSVIFPPSLTQ